MDKIKDDNIVYYRLPEIKKIITPRIFVFGSNERGAHGKGAAKDALLHYGAIYHRGEGRQGNSYAIPTKNKYILPLSLKDIAAGVNRFMQYTNDPVNTELRFFVTAVGTGLAGHSHKDIAPLFRGCINCMFPLEWKQYLQRDYNE